MRSKSARRSRVRIHLSHEGSLTSLGYHAHESAAVRHTALGKAINKYGASSVFKKINALSVFNKRVPELHRIYELDKAWVHRSISKYSPRSRASRRRRSCRRSDGRF